MCDKSQTPKSTINLRNKKKNEDNKLKKNSESSDSETEYDYDDENDSDYEPCEEAMVNNGLEYKKFLMKLFPSKYIENTIKDNEQQLLVEKSITNDKNESTDEEECNDDSEEFDTEEEEELRNLMKENMKFNIVFTINDVNDDDHDDDHDDDDDCENDDDDCENDDYGNDDYGNDDDGNDDDGDGNDNQKHKEESGKEKDKNKEKRGNQLHKETKLIDKKVNKKKIIHKKRKETITNKEKSNTDKTISKDKKTKETNGQLDSDTETTFKEIISLIKQKNKKACNDIMNKFDKYIEKEHKKREMQKKKDLRKKKVNNLQTIKKIIRGKHEINDFTYFKNLSIEQQENIINEAKEIEKYTNTEKPYRITLIESPIPAKYKANAFRKVNALRFMDPGSSEYYKIKQWVDTFMQIPFGKYNSLPISINDGLEKCNEFMENAKKRLDDAVYGLDDAKMQIMQMMGQWITNPHAVGTAIAIKGPMGTGKTTLVKDGISKILNRPFAFIALGGATDSSFLEGHSYTYEGSIWGKIVDIIIQSKCMNPVIYFDELDKVSETPKGEEIIGILTHLTDTTQNAQFHDKYFSDIEFDLSKALFIFSYNDENKVNAILKDRMYRIHTNGYETKEKITIAQNYMIPIIESNIKFNKGDIILQESALKHIIQNYTENEKGVRNLKRCLEILFTKLNLYRLMKPNSILFNEQHTFEVTFPFTITEDIITKLLKTTTDKTQMLYKNMYV